MTLAPSPAFRRSLLVAAHAATLALPLAAPALEAQRASRPVAQQRRVPRRIVFTALGLVVSGAAVAAYASADGDRHGTGSCTDKRCVIPVTMVAGGLVGYMIGREFDELHALRYRGGAPLAISSVTVPTTQSALGLAARDTLVAVAGNAGVQLYASTGQGLRALARRAGGVRGITALELTPRTGALAVGSAAGFYVFPPVSGPGLLLREGNTGAIAATTDRVYFGVGTRVEVAPPTADTTRGWPGADVGFAPSALHLDPARNLLWAAGDSVLAALRPEGDSLVVLGRLRVDGAVRRLDVEGTRVVLALGEGGLRLVDATDPATLRESASWTGTRFVYDAAFASPRRLLVASGADGLYVLDVSGTAPAVVGLSRELGFVTALVVDGRQAHLLDRAGDLLRRIDVSTF